MRNYTSNGRFKQVFKKHRVIALRGWTECHGRRFQVQATLPVSGANRWLESRVRKLVNEGADIKTISESYTRGWMSIARRGHARRQMQKVATLARRQTATAPVVARAHVRESAEKSADGGGGDDSGGDDAGPDADGPDVAPECSLLASLVGVVR